MLTQRRIDWLMGLGISGVVLLFVLMTRHYGHLQFLNFLVYDAFLQVTSDASAVKSPISLVVISEADIQALGRWPLTDQMLADLLQRLVEAEPIAVGVDIYRDLAVAPGTAALATILSADTSIIMIEKFGSGQRDSIHPPLILQGTDQVGFVDMIVDADGVARRGLLFLDEVGQPAHFSLALRMALRYLATQMIVPQADASEHHSLKLGHSIFIPFEPNDGAYVRADAGGYQYLLDFKNWQQPFPSYRLSDVLANKIPATAFKDKLVFVGVITDSVKDYFYTPLDRGVLASQVTPGVVLHARMTDQINRAAIQGDTPIRPIDEWWETLCIVLWCLLALGLGFYASTWWYFMMGSMLGLAGLMGLAFWLFTVGYWLPIAGAALAWFTCALPITAYISSSERGQRQLVMHLFSAHVSKTVAEEIWRQRQQYLHGGRLISQRMTVTALFCDLENFTPISEQLGPNQLMHWLTQYTDQMTQIVMRYGGVVDDFYGDAIKAEFGVPVARANHQAIKQDAIHAVQCANDMAQAVTIINARFQQQGLPAVRIRMGLATGEVVAGVIGHAQRMKYTTVGDVINTAARLEQFGKSAPIALKQATSSMVLMTEQTAKLVQDQVTIETFGQLALKGKALSVSAYRLIVS